MPHNSYYLISAYDIAKTNAQLIAEQNIILQKIFPGEDPEGLCSKLWQILNDDFKEKNPILVTKCLLEQINSDNFKRFSNESEFINEFKSQYLRNQRLIQEDLKEYIIQPASQSSGSALQEVAIESIGDFKKDFLASIRDIREDTKKMGTAIQEFVNNGANSSLSTYFLGTSLLGLTFLTSPTSGQGHSSSLRRNSLSPENLRRNITSSTPTPSASSTPMPKFEYPEYVANLNRKISSIRHELSTQNHGELPEFSEVMTRLKSSNAELFDENGKLIANSNSIFGEFYEGLDLSKMKIKYEDFKFFNNNNVKFIDVDFSGSEIGNETPPTKLNTGINILSGKLNGCVFKNLPRLTIGEDVFYKGQIASFRNANSGINTVDDSGNIQTSIIANHNFLNQQKQIFDDLKIDLTDTKFLGTFYNSNFASGDYKTANFSDASFLHLEAMSYSKKIPFGARTTNADLSNTKFGTFRAQESDEEYQVIDFQVKSVGASELELSEDMLDITGSRYILQSKIDELSKNQAIYIRVNFGDATNDSKAQVFKKAFPMTKDVDEETKKDLIDRVKQVIKKEFARFNIIAVSEDEKIPDDAIVKNLTIFAQDGIISVSQFAEFLDDQSVVVFGLKQPNRGFVVSHEIGHGLAGFDHPTEMRQSVMGYADFLNKLGDNEGLSSTPKYTFFTTEDRKVVSEIMKQVGRDELSTQEEEVLKYVDLTKSENRSTSFLGGGDKTKILKIAESDLQDSQRISIMRASDVMLSCIKTPFPKDCLMDKTLENSSALVIYYPHDGISRKNVKHIFIFDKGKNFVEIIDKDGSPHRFEINSDNFSEQQQKIIFDQGKITSSTPQTTAKTIDLELSKPISSEIQSNKELNPPEIAGIVTGAVLTLLGIACGIKKYSNRESANPSPSPSRTTSSHRDGSSETASLV